ncbi:MAG: Crp/Fnr family transcriptional regulator [Massiliimalia sp.]|jgi:CRP-like cAMP-binding protein
MTIHEFYQNIFPVSDEELIELLAGMTQIKEIPKGELLIEQGQIQEDIAFLSHGILRAFFIDANGQEITDNFGIHPGASAVACFKLNVPSLVSIEAITDTEIYYLPLSEVLKHLETNVSLIKLYNRLLQASILEHWEIKRFLTQHTAAQRYSWFLEKYPMLIDCVNHKYIASFLGISPVSLSRLRKNVKSITVPR